MFGDKGQIYVVKYLDMSVRPTIYRIGFGCHDEEHKDFENVTNFAPKIICRQTLSCRAFGHRDRCQPSLDLDLKCLTVCIQQSL